MKEFRALCRPPISLKAAEILSFADTSVSLLYRIILPSISRSIGRSIRLYIHSSVDRFTCSLFHISVGPSVFPFVRPSVLSSVRQCVGPFIYRSVHPFDRLSVDLYVGPQVCLSIYMSVPSSVWSVYLSIGPPVLLFAFRCTYRSTRLAVCPSIGCLPFRNTDVAVSKRFGTWTNRHLARSPPGQFGTWTISHLDGSTASRSFGIFTIKHLDKLALGISGDWSDLSHYVAFT